MRTETAIQITEQMLRSASGVISVNGIDTPIKAISTDSRVSRAHDLFIAIKGDNFDGEDFVNEARIRGAYTVSSRYASANVYVKDTKAFLLSLSGIYKDRIQPKTTVAITGSVGKTTTKDLCGAILSETLKVHATAGNLNNRIGVPHTLFSLPEHTEVLVVEAGMNHRGELSEIASILGHDIAVITNVGSAHIGNLGSREEIAKAKCEILESNKPLKALIPYGEKLLSFVDGKTVGVDCDAEYSLWVRNGSIEYRSARFSLTGIPLKLKGDHIPKCLAFAIAVADILGVAPEYIRKALESLHGISRETRITRVRGLRIIDDGYNASYESILCALKTLTRERGRRSAVIGDVLELGEFADDIHFAIGNACGLAGLSALFTFGKYAEQIARGAYASGMKKEAVFVNGDLSDPTKTAKDILNFSTADDIILFKASHSTKIGRIIDEIKSL